MTTTTASTAAGARKRRRIDDPEEYRMSIGDHLEELRWRLILALVGFVVAFGICLAFGNQVIVFFCRPLTATLLQRGINPQLYMTSAPETFMVYIRISLICGAAIGSPWMLYQFWLFVAAGLYRHERRWVLRYLPLSITLLLSGMVFVYLVVLPWSMNFFIGWGIDIPVPGPRSGLVENTPPLLAVPLIAGDPADPTLNGIWYNTVEHRIKVRINGQDSVIQFLPTGLVAPHISLEPYINLVVMMLMVFGLAFQLPIVVMALLKIGIVEADQLRRARRVVYFALLIVSAAITPGDVITVTVALLLPLILLYEFGIFLGTRGERAAPAAEED